VSTVPTYSMRLEAARGELRAAGLSCRSPAFHLGRALRLPVRPPHYLGLMGAILHYASMVVPVTGLALWLLVWRHDDIRPLSLLSPVLQVGALPTLCLALFTWLVARWKRLSRWQALGTPSPVAETSS